MINGRTNISQSGRVVVNAVLIASELAERKTADLSAVAGKVRLYGEAILDDSYLGILPGEPLLMNKSASTRKRKALRDTHLEIFSSLNGLLVKQSESVEDVEKKYRFAGFADTAAHFDSSKMKDEDTVAQVGGIRTIMNTGTRNIVAGDILVWRLPNTKDVRPNANKKLLVEVEPWRSHAHYSKEMIKTRIETSGDPLNELLKNKENLSGKEDISNFLAGAFNLFHEEYLSQKSRVVGKALSDARPGTQLDILLGSYCI